MSLLQNSPISAQTPGTASLPFKQMFERALADVEETSAIKSQDGIDLALGATDDLAAIQINGLKGDIATTALVTLRDRILDAYSEIMRINV